MPLLVLGAAVCPKGAEGTFYAFLMSLTEVGGILGDLTGTALTSWLGVDNNNFDNLWVLVLLCNVFGLLPLLLLPWIQLPVEAQTPEEEQNESELGVELSDFGVDQALIPEEDELVVAL